ncbi:MAG TPA: hypothetical protein VN213_09735 [Solirubrobacteraceae bacterium]|nr:hypothetical protein [Solirubrobacteraceae bacterium]
MNKAREIGAYLGLVLLAVCVLSAAVIGANIAEGLLSIPAAIAAAVAAFQALRRVTGRIVGAAVDSL